MTRLTFNKKLFVRHPELDFADDGTKFRILYYKDRLPLSVANCKYGSFVCIRLDYAGHHYPEYKEDYAILDEFNGVPSAEYVDMDKLVANCEYIMEKYGL